MKLILALPAVGLLFSSLTIIPNRPTASLLPTPDVSIPDAPTFWAGRSACFKNETFELHFAQPHATTLGVVNPDGKFFYLVFPAACTIGDLKPLITSEDFASCTSLTICPATLTADPYTFGVTENQPVFTKSGIYKFILGDNLHVDDEQSLNIVSVRYQHKKR